MENNWISVETELPKKSTSKEPVKILIHCKPIDICIGQYWGIEHIGGVTNGWDIMDVTHWMPLPAPPSPLNEQVNAD